MDILKDSSFYQVLQEWAGEARERQGRIKEARDTLFRLGRIRFGRLPKAARATIEAIDDLERLQHLSQRLFTATSWDDLLAETK